jgi:sarcosine oxidase subunit gamma
VYAREVINGGCPLDLDDAAFPPGRATRTLLGKAEIVLLRPDTPHTYRIECWRSFAPYVRGLLAEVAREFETNADTA